VTVVYRPLLTLSIFMLPVNVLIGAVFWNMSILPLMLWAVSGPFFPLFSYAVADILIRRRPTQPDFEVALSQDDLRIVIRSGFVFFLLYLVSGIVYKAYIL
jgi:hypothetical protein